MEAHNPKLLLDRIHKLETRLRLVGVGWILTLLLTLLLPVWGTQQENPATQDVVRVRQLHVVDQKGISRVVIGAPMPNPQIRGKLGKRRSPGYGIQFNDVNGDEIGGAGALEDGTSLFCFDYKGKERTTERLCLAQRPNGAAGFSLMDNAGKTRVRIAISETGTPTLELLDEQGKPLFRAPESTTPNVGDRKP